MGLSVFTAGERYGNAEWEYEVLTIESPTMTVRSDGGQTRKLHVETASRAWGALQKNAARRARRKRAAARV